MFLNDLGSFGSLNGITTLFFCGNILKEGDVLGVLLADAAKTPTVLLVVAGTAGLLLVVNVEPADAPF